MKLFHVFSSSLLTDGFIIDWGDSQGLVNEVVANFAQDTFSNNVIQDALFNNQGLLDQAISDGLNGENFDSLQADAQAALANSAFETVFGDSAETIFALQDALNNPDILADTIASVGGLQAAQDALKNAQNNPAFEDVFNDVGGFQNAETMINNAVQNNFVPDDASTTNLSISIVSALIMMRLYH